MKKPVRVVVVDDSALIRQLLTKILSDDPDVEVVGAAVDPYDARDKIKALNPDVITLDVEMPRMDGLAFLEKIMRLRPMPVVMVSTLTQKGAETTIKALEMGAVDFVGKPTANVQQGLEALGEELIAKVKAAAVARVSAHAGAETAPRKALIPQAGYVAGRKVVAIGSSTGGVEAVRDVLALLPAQTPPILITQHMPAHFTPSFANRLDKITSATVAEARDGEPVQPNHVYIAPGDRHLELARNGAGLVCRIGDGPPVSGHRPSVDVLFRSVAKVMGAGAIGVILTGMGRDGALGLKEMREAGAATIGQDESSCVVYGMPRAAKEAGGVAVEVPLSRVTEEILRNCR